MDVHAGNVCIDLPGNRHLTLDNVRGTPLRVTRGTVWITQEHSYDDIILSAGDHWTVQCAGRTIIEAQGDALLVLSPSVPAWRAQAERLLQRWNKGAGAWARRMLREWSSLRPKRSLPYY